MSTETRPQIPTGWYDPAACDLQELADLVEQTTEPSEYPHAEEVVQGVLVYGAALREAVAEPQTRRTAQAELARALAEGPGIVLFRGAVVGDAVDAASAVFTRLIDEQRGRGYASGDHFAKPGANDRLWGALDKLAVADPEVFAAYYSNDVLALVSEAWLGPRYQVTSQVNVVNPGGEAQVAHRDYHLGFMSRDQALGYPGHVHALSPVLTLQGAVAHVDMPVETGPTLYLPYSQRYPAGYVAYHQPEFTAYFDDHRVQLPLAKGDAAFFNPALFHGAGANRSPDVRRMANLLQVSSAFGRAMETVDRPAVLRVLYPVLKHYTGNIENVIAASAEGYAFPTNLDVHQPVGGLAPPTQADVVRQALAEGWDDARFERSL